MVRRRRLLSAPAIALSLLLLCVLLFAYTQLLRTPDGDASDVRNSPPVEIRAQRPVSEEDTGTLSFFPSFRFVTAHTILHVLMS
jgi:hypothetical protein